jgi:PAS domain S-box-containing protein
VTIPLALLALAVPLALFDLRSAAGETVRQVEVNERRGFGHRMVEVRSHLEFLLREGDLERAQEELARLGADPSVRLALLVDGGGEVAASMRRADVGVAAVRLYPRLTDPVVAGAVAQAQATLGDTVVLNGGGRVLVGVSPVVSEVAALPSSRATYLLVAERDIGPLRAESLAQVQDAVLRRTAGLTATAAGLWLFFHLAVTRRARRLVAASRRVSAGDWRARARLGGRDELAEVGRAFDAMVGSLASAHAQLEASEARTRLLLDSTAEGIYGVDLAGRATFTNPAALQLLGLPAEGGGLGANAHEAWHHRRADGTPFPAEECPILQQTLREGTPVHVAEDTFWRPDGTRVPVEYWAHPVRREGRLEGAVVTFVDISERTRAEDAQRFLVRASTELSELQEVDATLTKVAHLAVPRLGDWCVVDVVEEDGSLRRAAAVHADPSRAALLEELGRRYPPGWHTTHASVRVLHAQRPLALAGPEAIRAHGFAADGAHGALLEALGTRAVAALPLSARGQTFGALTLVSARPGAAFGEHELALAAELARRASVAVDNARLYRGSQQAVRLREEFLSVASHELRTPLTPLQLQLQLVRGALASGGAQRDPARYAGKLDNALAQVRRLVRLVDDLLDTARLVAGKLQLHREEVDLVELTRELLERFGEHARAAGCALSLEAPERPLVGVWDRMRLEQVLTNLLSNAIKYGPRAPVEVRVGEEGGRAVWSVRDHGIGVAPESLGRIFGRFERAVSAREYGGLGLGLYISYEIVQSHGGELRVESTLGEGSLFTLALPREVPAVRDTEGAGAQP